MRKSAQIALYAGAYLASVVGATEMAIEAGRFGWDGSLVVATGMLVATIAAAGWAFVVSIA